MTIEHSPMLMRRFKSMARYSNQGFEAAHKVHRQLYAHCTNHDSSASESSSKWIRSLLLFCPRMMTYIF